MKDLYQILGIDRTSTIDQIKLAYKEKVKTLHPDKGGSEEEFIELMTAYSILSNYNTKAEYDRTGTYALSNVELYGKVVKKLASIFANYLEANLKNTEISKINHIELLKSQIEYIISDLVKKHSKFFSDAKQIAEMKRRLKYNGEKENLLEMILNERMRRCELFKKESEEEIEILRGCKAFLMDYQFDVLMFLTQ